MSGQNAATYFDFVIKRWVVENMHRGMHCSGFGIFGAVNQAADARVNHGPGAHSAGLNSHEKIASAQAMIAEGGPGFPQGDNFRVSCWVSIGEIAIESAADDFALMHDDRADWHFSQVESTLGGPQGFVHPQFVGFGTCAVLHEQYCMRMVGLKLSALAQID